MQTLRRFGHWAFLLLTILAGLLLLFIGTAWVQTAIYDRLNYTVRGVNGEWRGMLAWGAGILVLSLPLILFGIVRIRRIVREKKVVGSVPREAAH